MVSLPGFPHILHENVPSVPGFPSPDFNVVTEGLAAKSRFIPDFLELGFRPTRLG